jgi:hypothetical protein
MTISAASPKAWENDRAFYLGVSIAMALTVFAGFAPTYFLKSYFGAPPLSLLVHVHGVAFSGWLAVLVTQTALIAGGRPDIHRKLGVAGSGLAAVMVILGVATAVQAIRSNHTPPGLDPRSFLVLPFFAISVFAFFVGLGVAFRNKNPEIHKRLMLLATIAMLNAAVARLPGVFALGPLAIFGLPDLFLVTGAAYDFASRGRVNPAYIWGGLFLVLTQPLQLFVSNTPWWLAFGDWLKG